MIAFCTYPWTDEYNEFAWLCTDLCACPVCQHRFWGLYCVFHGLCPTVPQQQVQQGALELTSRIFSFWEQTFSWLVHLWDEAPGTRQLIAQEMAPYPYDKILGFYSGLVYQAGLPASLSFTALPSYSQQVEQTLCSLPEKIQHHNEFLQRYIAWLLQQSLPASYWSQIRAPSQASFYRLFEKELASLWGRALKIEQSQGAICCSRQSSLQTDLCEVCWKATP